MASKISKKTIAVIAALAFLAGFMIFRLVSAYFTDSEIAVNTISVGHNEHVPHEEFEPPNGNNWYKKSIKIVNTGSVPSYVRVYLSFSEDAIRDISIVSPEAKSYDDGETEPTTWYSLSAAPGTTHEIDGVEYESYFDHLPEHWHYIPETGDVDSALLGGYFYYDLPLKVGEPTDPGVTTEPNLIGTVKTMFAELGEYRPYDIYVYSESIQTSDKNGQLFASDKDHLYTDTTAYLPAWREYLSRK